MIVHVYDKPVKITAETIQKTREHFADTARACIDAATKGEFHVNDLSSYIVGQQKRIADDLAGTNDHTLTFIQRAVWIQTGESVPLLA